MSLPKKPKEYPPAPYWKEHIPRCNEHTEWARDEHGFPVFHDDGKCVCCKKAATAFTHPWYKFKYQILGYCEGCTITKMGTAPTPEEERKHAEEEKKKKKPAVRIISTLCPEIELIQELEQILQDL